MATSQNVSSVHNGRIEAPGIGMIRQITCRPAMREAFGRWKKESDGIGNAVLGENLMDAIRAKDIDGVSDHLRTEANPDHRSGKDGMTLLMCAASMTERSIVRLLLDAQADPTLKDANGLDAMNHVKLAQERFGKRSGEIKQRMDEISEKLQKDGGAMEQSEKDEELSKLGSSQEELDSITALSVECDRISSLIEKKLDTILLEAAWNDDLAMATAAIEAAADPIALDQEGRSAFMIAREKGYVELARFLKDELDQTLSVLIEEGDNDQIMAAMRAGADPIDP